MTTKPFSPKLILPFVLIVLAAVALLCACHKKETPAPAPVPPTAGGPAIVSAERTSFDQVTSKLDKGGNLYLYLSTEKALSGLSGRIASFSNMFGNLPGINSAQTEIMGNVFTFVDAWVKDSGVEQISGVGMSSIAREPGFYYSKFIVHHYEGQNDGEIWSLFGKAPHPLTELDLLPTTTVFAMFSDFDAPLLWTNIQKHIAVLNLPKANDALKNWPDQFHEKTGLDFNDVLGSLGGNYGVIVTLDPDKKVSLPLPSGAMEIGTPGLAIIGRVNSDVIFNRVDELCKNNPLVVRVDKPDLKMRSMALPIPLPIELKPSIARAGDYLILASSDTMVQDILAVKSGAAKGFKSTPEFARLSQGIPTDGNNFFIVADRFAKSVMQIQQQALTNKGNMTPAQVQAIQQAFAAGTNSGSYSVGANGPEGWEAIANGCQSGQTFVLGAAAGAIGMVAAVAIPNFVKARATSQENACINNLRLIDAAKQQWALEHNKQSGDTPTEDDLKPYLNGKFPVCPGGGAYTIGPVGQKPTCTVAGHVLP